MTQANKYNLRALQDKAIYLVEEGFIGRYQPIYALSLYINFCEFALLEMELKQRNLQIGSRIIDLINNDTFIDQPNP